MRKINEHKLYRDTETGEIINELDLYVYYLDMVYFTDIECDFWGYLRNCLDKNEFLEEI